MKKREFTSGATRNSDEGKLDYEGFTSPLVDWAFAQYMHKHRLHEDGTLRDSDNWQKGIPLEELMKSAHRHWKDVWLTHRGIDVIEKGERVTKLDALLGLKFNVNAMILDELKDIKTVEREYIEKEKYLSHDEVWNEVYNGIKTGIDVLEKKNNIEEFGTEYHPDYVAFKHVDIEPIEYKPVSPENKLLDALWDAGLFDEPIADEIIEKFNKAKRVVDRLNLEKEYEELLSGVFKHNKHILEENDLMNDEDEPCRHEDGI